MSFLYSNVLYPNKTFFTPVSNRICVKIGRILLDRTPTRKCLRIVENLLLEDEIYIVITHIHSYRRYIPQYRYRCIPIPWDYKLRHFGKGYWHSYRPCLKQYTNRKLLILFLYLVRFWNANTKNKTPILDFI